MKFQLQEVFSTFTEEHSSKEKNERTQADIIRGWAKAFRIGALILFGLSLLAAIIILAVEEYLWFVSLIVLGSAGIILICAFFSATMILGFADIVENTAKMAGEQVAFDEAVESEELPEL